MGPGVGQIFQVAVIYLRDLPQHLEMHMHKKASFSDEEMGGSA